MKRASATALVAALLLGLYWVGMAAYEQAAFGWHFAREEVPLHSGWHWFRLGVNAALSFVLVGALWRSGLATEPVASPSRRTSWAVAALSVVAAALLLASPVAYARLGAEDGAVEWLSASFLLVASALMALSFRARWRRATDWRWLQLIGAAGLCVLFFVMAGEEVSWLQRQIGFDAPERIAERNWQGEFNLHNFNTDISELALYAGSAAMLLLLPLLRESAPGRWSVFRPFASFLPGRMVAAMAMPMLVFTYSHWTLLPVQAAFFIGLGVCIAFAATAASRAEKALWMALAAWTLVGQAFHLLIGHTMLMPYDSTEYREMFIAIGLVAYGWQQWKRASA